MRYRKQDENYDYVWGHNQNDYLVDTPEAVALYVHSRLLLFLGEFFLDTSEGMDWYGSVLGKFNEVLRDAAVRQCILETPYVIANGITKYASSFNRSTRVYSVTANVLTAFSSIPVTVTTDIPPFGSDSH